MENNKKYMAVDDVYALVSDLAKSQGIYSRMKLSMEENWNAWAKLIEEQQFTDSVDFMMWVEC